MMKYVSLVKAGVWLAKNWYYWYEKILTIIGNIKIFPYPCWVHYNPNEFEYKLRGEDVEKIMSVVQPGDLILRKYEHYLDSSLIPGEYSHSSVYIGNNKIIHAVSEGVKEIHIIDFCQCDGILVLRPTSGQEKAIERVIRWVGKEYDFKFNSTDSSEFYCHELSAKAYDELNVEGVHPSVMGIELKFLKKKYLAECFKEPNFTKVIEV